MPIPKHRYKVTLNWQGERHIMYSTANKALVAKMSVLTRLSKKVDRSIKFLVNYFDGSKDNIKIEEVR